MTVKDVVVTDKRTGRGTSVKLPDWLVDQAREVAALSKTDIQSLCTEILAPRIAELRKELLRRALEGYGDTPQDIPQKKRRGRPRKGG